MDFKEFDEKTLKENVEAIDKAVNEEIKARNNPKLSYVARISAYLSKLKLSLKK